VRRREGETLQRPHRHLNLGVVELLLAVDVGLADRLVPAKSEKKFSVTKRANLLKKVAQFLEMQPKL
jgi:hypothetical protein